MPINVIIRHEHPQEVRASEDILRKAYGREDEVLMTQALRKSAEFSPESSIVADKEGEILGYALFSRVTVVGATGDAHKAFALAPIAVRPDFQRRGIGERLVRHGLERCRSQGVELVFVAGLPGYFSRVGFRAAVPLGLEPEIAVPDGEFQAIDLSGRLLGKVKGRVLFPGPFKA